jgi:hypothetical protein
MDGKGRPFLDYIPAELVERKLNQEMELHLVNGSIIRILGSDNVDSLVGGNPVGIIFTEYSLHKDVVWDYLRPILAENDGWAIFNGTPRGLNHFNTMFKVASGNPEWFVQYLTATDTGYPTKEEIQKERDAGMPEGLVQQEFYCSWTASSEGVCIPLEIIQPCIDRVLNFEDYEAEPDILGIDVAYAAKGDKAVIAHRRGRKLYPLESYQGLDNMDFASKIDRKIKEVNPKMVFIDAGMGSGVISRLRKLGHESIVIPINFGGTPRESFYANKTTEMWVRTRDWIASQEPSLPNDEILIRDLSCPFLDSRDQRGKVKIESKDSRRKRGFGSTDEADAVILTHAEDVVAMDFMQSWTSTTNNFEIDTTQFI